MSLYSNIYFYGGGAWGQALAISLASIGHGSTLIVSDKSREQEITRAAMYAYLNSGGQAINPPKHFRPSKIGHAAGSMKQSKMISKKYQATPLPIGLAKGLMKYFKKAFLWVK